MHLKSFRLQNSRLAYGSWCIFGERSKGAEGMVGSMLEAHNGTFRTFVGSAANAGFPALVSEYLQNICPLQRSS